MTHELLVSIVASSLSQKLKIKTCLVKESWAHNHNVPNFLNHLNLRNSSHSSSINRGYGLRPKIYVKRARLCWRNVCAYLEMQNPVAWLAEEDLYQILVVIFNHYLSIKRDFLPIGALVFLYVMFSELSCVLLQS